MTIAWPASPGVALRRLLLRAALLAVADTNFKGLFLRHPLVGAPLAAP
jgi:hypothetical protein